MSQRGAQLGLFALISTIWGLTWIPAKVGVAGVPPMLFAAARGLAAGLVLIALFAARGGAPRVPRALVPRLLALGALGNAATYGLLFWGVGRVDSGLAAVLNLALMPLLMLLLGAALGEERVTLGKVATTLLGVAGLAVLYAEGLRAGSGEAAGILAVVGATFCYALGILFGREVLRHCPAVLVAGWTQLVGAALLFAASAWLEPGSPGALAGLAQPRVLASWSFLVLFGSVVAFTGYLRLTHEWNPSRAACYAFVSPVIAVVAGVLVLGETVAPRELAGMALMVVATALALTAEVRAGQERPEARLEARR